MKTGGGGQSLSSLATNAKPGFVGEEYTWRACSELEVIVCFFPSPQRLNVFFLFESYSKYFTFLEYNFEFF